MKTSPVAVAVDADVLYGATTRALLVYLDHHDLIRMHWSPLLILEMSRALVATGRKTVDAARRNQTLMAQAVPGAEVTTLEVHAAFARAYPGIRDAKDLHVAACAVALLAGAYYPAQRTAYLVTRNTKDFAPKKLAALGILQLHPDAFLLELWQRDADGMSDAFRALRADLPSAPSVERLLEKLNNDGQRRTADAMGIAQASGMHAL